MDKFMTANEIAARLGITTRTLRRMRARGEFPAGYQLGYNMIRWEASAVEKWMREKKKKE